jgi:hypothetical protein
MSTNVPLRSSYSIYRVRGSLHSILLSHLKPSQSNSFSVSSQSFPSFTQTRSLSSLTTNSHSPSLLVRHQFSQNNLSSLPFYVQRRNKSCGIVGLPNGMLDIDPNYILSAITIFLLIFHNCIYIALMTSPLF